MSTVMLVVGMEHARIQLHAQALALLVSVPDRPVFNVVPSLSLQAVSPVVSKDSVLMKMTALAL